MKRTKRIIALLLMLCMAAALFAGCGDKTEPDTPPSPSPSAASEPPAQPSPSEEPLPSEEPAKDTHTVVDFYGNAVEVPNNIERMICVTPAASQILLLLGGGEKLAAGAVSKSPLNMAMFPYLDNVVQMTRDDMNAESVLEINPDVIIWAFGVDLPEGVAELDIPVVCSNIASPDDLMAAVKQMGEVLGGDSVKKAEIYCDFYQGLIDDISALTADIPDEDKPLLYFTASDDGLSSFGIESMPYNWATVSGAKYSGEVLGIQEMRATLTAEQLLELNPDIIVCTSNAAKEMFLTEDAYSGISAVINEKVYVTPTGASVWYLGHVEAPLELTWAPTIILPELAEQIKTEELVRYFYENLYEYELSAEEYESMINPK